MRACALPALLWICAWSVGAADTSSQPTTTAPAQADKLAAENLNHAARSLGHLRDDAVVARAGRIRALLRYARSLAPENPRTNRQLVDLHEGLGQSKLAAAAADRYLHVRPHDHALGVRWMRLAQATLSAADERIALLKKAAERRQFLPETRARAWGELCGIYLRQGEDAKASAACERALALDASESTALRAQARLKRQPSPMDDFEVALGLFRSNPRSLRLTWKLAQMLQGVGAYSMSIEFYKHAYAIAGDGRPARKVMETLLLDYVNAMLDAGRAAEAVAFFEPLIKDYGYNLGLRALMVEALRMLKRDDEASLQVAFMARVYEPLTEAAQADRTAGGRVGLVRSDLQLAAPGRPGMGQGGCPVSRRRPVCPAGHGRGRAGHRQCGSRRQASGRTGG